MPDITMCYGTNCPRQKSCVRCTSTPNPYRQSFFCETPVKKDGSCEYFWLDEYAKESKKKEKR